MERGSLQARRERLTRLALAVGPVAFARDRVLPVVPPLQSLFPESGLVRGSIIGCQGGTAVSVALATVSAASAAGSWLACVGLATLGLQAANELGIALERLVMVSSPRSDSSPEDANTQIPNSQTPDPEVPNPNNPNPNDTANVMSALIDGFDLIVVRSPPVIRSATARQLQARLQARGAVLVVIGNPGQFSCDVTITGLGAVWEGLGEGTGRLARRRLVLSATGRRSPRARRVEVWLPGANGGIEPASTGTSAGASTGTSTAFRQTG